MLNLKWQKRGMKFFVSLTVMSLLFLNINSNGAAEPSEELVLVENGHSLAPVVIFEDAPPFTRRAADELANYMEKISGSRPEVIEGEPDPTPENAIWVGVQPKVRELFPDLNLDFEKPEEILIAASQNHLLIAGRDVWDPDNMVRQIPRGRTVEGVQRQYGTVNAVYTFIQDYLDVRWLWPGSLGEDIIEQNRIAFSPFEYRYHPQIRGRKGIFTRWRLGRHGFRTSLPQQNWMRFQRLLFDSLEAPGGHAYTDWWERFHETNPEYFALQPDGTRGGGDNPYPRAKTVKICHSNPDVWEQWLADVEDQIARDPGRTVFNASPNDGYSSGHCICPDCLAWDSQDAEKLTFTWQGISQQYYALSDRHVKFANKVGSMLKERYPDRDYYVLMLAYGNWRPVPKETRPDDNVIIASVNNFHNRPGQEESRERFKRWAEVASNLVWRPNLGFGVWQIGLPRVAMRRAIDDIRMVAENNAIGIFFDMVWGHWSTHGPHYYMLGRMAWNPYADGEAILKDYYQRGFGPAADHVEAYWTFQEETTAKYVYGDSSWEDEYNEEFFEKANAFLERGREAAQDGPDKYLERIDFLQVGLDFSELFVEVKGLMDRYQASDEQDTEARETAREIWLEKMRPLINHDKYPVALNQIFAGPQAGRAYRYVYPEGLREEW